MKCDCCGGVKEYKCQKTDENGDEFSFYECPECGCEEHDYEEEE